MIYTLLLLITNNNKVISIINNYGKLRSYKMSVLTLIFLNTYVFKIVMVMVCKFSLYIYYLLILRNSISKILFLILTTQIMVE